MSGIGDKKCSTEKFFDNLTVKVQIEAIDGDREKRLLSKKWCHLSKIII